MSNQKEVALFVMEQPATFTWPVEVRIPLDGKYGVATFVGEFPNLSDADRDALLASDESGAPVFTSQQVADQVLLGFDKLQSAGGGLVPFTPENKAALLKQARVANAVVGTFMAVTRGVAAEKNV